MRTVACIQARMGSTRLPGKALADISGKSMLARTVERLSRARSLDVVAIATTTSPQDQLVVDEARHLAVPSVRGSEDDVLHRYEQAARDLDADIIVRVTSDCPLIDASVADLVVNAFLAAAPRCNYASNTLQRTYPRGLDVEVFDRPSLEQACRHATEMHQREHVTPYFHENPNAFRLLSVTNNSDLSHHRWTVDTDADLAYVRAIYAAMGTAEFDWQDVLALLERRQELRAINRDVQQKPLRVP